MQLQARGIDDEAAFAYWVPYTLRKRDIIISVIKSCARKTSHKYRVVLPTSVEHAYYELDEKNGNTLWHDAIKKEMHNIGIAFEILEEGENVPVGWRLKMRSMSLTNWRTSSILRSFFLFTRCRVATMFIIFDHALTKNTLLNLQVFNQLVDIIAGAFASGTVFGRNGGSERSPRGTVFGRMEDLSGLLVAQNDKASGGDSNNL